MGARVVAATMSVGKRAPRRPWCRRRSSGGSRSSFFCSQAYPGTSRKPLAQTIATLAQVANRLRKQLLPWHESQTACAKNCYPGTSRKPLAQKIATLARVASRLRKKLLPWHESQTACAKICVLQRGCNRLLVEGVQPLACQAGVQLSTRRARDVVDDVDVPKSALKRRPWTGGATVCWSRGCNRLPVGRGCNSPLV